MWISIIRGMRWKLWRWRWMLWHQRPSVSTISHGTEKLRMKSSQWKHTHIGVRGMVTEMLINWKRFFLDVADLTKKIHDNCHPSSWCKLDPNYEPSKVILTSSTAETLLKNTLTRSFIYKEAQHYCLARDTFFVESFNNVFIIFHDKRISLGNSSIDWKLIRLYFTGMGIFCSVWYKQEKI